MASASSAASIITMSEARVAGSAAFDGVESMGWFLMLLAGGRWRGLELVAGGHHLGPGGRIVAIDRHERPGPRALAQGLDRVERGEFDDHNAQPVVRTLEDRHRPAADDEAPAEPGDHPRRVLDVLAIAAPVGHLDAGDDIAGHGAPQWRLFSGGLWRLSGWSAGRSGAGVSGRSARAPSRWSRSRCWSASWWSPSWRTMTGRSCTTTRSTTFSWGCCWLQPTAPKSVIVASATAPGMRRSFMQRPFRRGRRSSASG